jgi:CheY-like chemotaxis protein
MHSDHAVGIVIVLFGAPLPGRDLLERALEEAVPDHIHIVAGAYPTAAQRAMVSRALEAAGSRPLYVEWACSAAEAEREIFRHYAAMPRRLRDQRWNEFLSDFAAREPVGREAWPLVVVHAGEPIDQAVAAVTAALDARAAEPTVPRQVLVVDDDPGQRELLSEALTQLGCTVCSAGNGEEALALALTTPFDLVLTDHRMPGVSGVELAGALHAIDPDVHVAVITGHADEALDALVVERGVDVVLSKPIGITDLIHVVDELARRRHGRAAPPP